MKMLKLLVNEQTVVKSCHAIFLEGSPGHIVVQSRALALVRGLKLHKTLLVSLCPFNEYLGIDIITKRHLHFGTE